MFECFNENAIKVIVAAQQEASEMNCNFIGTEHILLGILKVDDGVRNLINYNDIITLDKVLPKVRVIAATMNSKYKSDFKAVEISFTPRCKKSLEIAHNLHKDLNSKCINPAHLLYGILKVDDSEAVQVLNKFGLQVDNFCIILLNFITQKCSYYAGYPKVKKKLMKIRKYKSQYIKIRG